MSDRTAVVAARCVADVTDAGGVDPGGAGDGVESGLELHPTTASSAMRTPIGCRMNIGRPELRPSSIDDHIIDKLRLFDIGFIDHVRKPYHCARVRPVD